MGLRLRQVGYPQGLVGTRCLVVHFDSSEDRDTNQEIVLHEVASSG